MQAQSAGACSFRSDWALAPGTGSRITAFAVDYYPPPTPFDNNPTWQAVKKALNADMQMTQVSGPQDLTPFLAGDSIKEYPNLAAIPTYAWSNSACVIDGALYSWPIHRYLGGLRPRLDVWRAEPLGAGLLWQGRS